MATASREVGSEQDLASVDRAATPWLIVMMHAPFYNSNSAHALEAELDEAHVRAAPPEIRCGRRVEPPRARVRKERRARHLRRPTQPCGPVYLNLGDGGNREGGEAAWVAPHPEWSAFRESSFGVGALDIHERDARDVRVAPRRVRRIDGAALRPRCERPRRRRTTPAARTSLLTRSYCAAICPRIRRAPPSERTRRQSRRSPTAGGKLPNEANDDDAPPPIARERRSVELSLVAIILGTAASFILGPSAAGAGRAACRRRPSETMATPHKGYGLVDEKAVADSVIVL